MKADCARAPPQRLDAQPRKVSAGGPGSEARRVDQVPQGMIIARRRVLATSVVRLLVPIVCLAPRPRTFQVLLLATAALRARAAIFRGLLSERMSCLSLAVRRMQPREQLPIVLSLVIALRRRRQRCRRKRAATPRQRLLIRLDDEFADSTRLFKRAGKRDKPGKNSVPPPIDARSASGEWHWRRPCISRHSIRRKAARLSREALVARAPAAPAFRFLAVDLPRLHPQQQPRERARKSQRAARHGRDHRR